MSRIYSNTNRIRFTDIPDKYSAPRAFRSKLNEVHTAVVIYVFEHYKDTRKYRQQVVDAINCLSYCVIQNCFPSMEWKASDPLNTMPQMDMDEVESSLGDFFLTVEAVEWNLSPADDESIPPIMAISTPVSANANKEIKALAQLASKPGITVINRPLHEVRQEQKVEFKKSPFMTPKEDLYIQPPKCPRFDINKVWMAQTVGRDNLVIYTTLPEIPTKQNEISITTNVSAMTNEELMKLYPNQVIHTRHPDLYEHYKDIEYDPDLGCIFPIEGFSYDQIVDNIIRYPHLFRLRKDSPSGEPTKFFSSIEINGSLIPIEEAWDTFPESKVIPRDPEFVKEYVIRRYLLEEECGISHMYNIVGTLDPFLTLFMPATKYIERGYTDVLEIVKHCVMARVKYKQSRSPILRRIEEERKNA